MTIRLDELYICVRRMTFMQFTGQPPPSATSTSFKLTDHEIQESVKYYVTRKPNGYILPNPNRSVNSEKKFPGPSDSSVYSTVWKFACEYSRNCGNGTLPLLQCVFVRNLPSVAFCHLFCLTAEFARNLYQGFNDQILTRFFSSFGIFMTSSN